MESYARVKLLGEGSFGRVFLVREKRPSGRLVCIKQIRRIGKTEESRLPRGLEAELMKRLRHPNLIRLLHVFVSPPPLRQQHIVMEYCSGGDLHTHLRRTRAASRAKDSSLCLGEDKIWFWFLQLALGLHHMHQQRVLHRDVKTANIFLSNAGFLVLGDLGVAKMLGIGEVAATVIGTPLYMAPEVLEGKAYDFSSDVWALGCVLYELCTGKPPFAAKNTPQLMSKICHGSYAPISKDAGLGVSRLPALVASMLSTRPELRPSVDQILREPSAYIHLQRYFSDRLRTSSTSGLTETERRALQQQMRSLGIKFSVQCPTEKGGVETVEGGAGCTLPDCSGDPSSRHQSRADRHKAELERRLKEVREHERQEQLLFALEKLQQMRFQHGVNSPRRDAQPEAKCDKNKEKDDVVPALDLTRVVLHEPMEDAEWRDPVRAPAAVSDIGNGSRSRAVLHRGRSNSVPTGQTFSGIPRAGVPLTAQAKTFAAKTTVCRDVRVLRKQEAAKAAERYKRQLVAAHAPRHRREAKSGAEAAAGAAKPRHQRRSNTRSETHAGSEEERDTDAAILRSMAGLRETLKDAQHNSRERRSSN